MQGVRQKLHPPATCGTRRFPLIYKVFLAAPRPPVTVRHREVISLLPGCRGTTPLIFKAFHAQHASWHGDCFVLSHSMCWIRELITRELPILFWL